LRDARPVIEHLLKRGLKLEQEGVEILKTNLADSLSNSAYLSR